MSFAGAMFAVTGCTAFVALHTLGDLGFFGSTGFVVSMLVAWCAFGLLCAAHLLCLVLRCTIWSDPEV